MKNIKIKYYNLENNNKYIKSSSNKIDKKIFSLPIFKIISNNKLTNEIIKTAKEFEKDKKGFFVFGTGGSNLGAKALISILQGKEKNRLIFYDNIDPQNFKNSIEKYNYEKFGFIIISKSGKTPETLAQFGSLIEIFDKKKKLIQFYKKCLIITEDRPSPLRNIAIKNKCLLLNHEKEIGGRYSVFSNVGAVPAVLAGFNIKKFHQGAKDTLNYLTKNNNYIVHSRFAKILSSSLQINVMMTYSDSLYYFGKWFLQLWAESSGKNGLGITPIHSIGTTDQHSQLQLFLDGPKDKFFTFIATNHKKKGLKINKQIMIQNNSSFLGGKKMGDLMDAEQKATISTFIKKGIPIRKIYLQEINEYSIGQLMSLTMFETITTCNLLNVDPFNQPAVEQGKILTKKYLNQ